MKALFRHKPCSNPLDSAETEKKTKKNCLTHWKTSITVFSKRSKLTAPKKFKSVATLLKNFFKLRIYQSSLFRYSNSSFILFYTYFDLKFSNIWQLSELFFLFLNIKTNKLNKIIQTAYCQCDGTSLRYIISLQSLIFTKEISLYR